MKASSLFWTRALFGVLFAVITFLTVTPNPDDVAVGFDLARAIADLLLGNPDYGDKVAHFAGYGALGASAFWARLFIGGNKWITPLLLGVYGAMLEGVQGLGAVRSMEALDATANGLGAISGFVFALALRAFFSRDVKGVCSGHED